MKPYLPVFSSACLLLFAGCVSAPQMSAQSSATSTAVAQPGQLEQLTAPIALYPDALVALILPASTESSDVVLAARYLNGGGDPQQTEQQPWDDSVKGLTHYPDVVKWMDENLAWTRQMGEAYLDEPEEVMKAIQRVRLRARSTGLLVSTAEQQVIVEDGIIRIVPAQAQVIYVPRYDPQVIYVDRPYYYTGSPWLTFGVGFGVGAWLINDCDWHRRVIWVDHRRRQDWHHRHDWRHPAFPGRPGYVNHGSDWRRWESRRPHPNRPFDRHDRPAYTARPTPLPGTPGWRDHRPGRPDRFADHDNRPQRPPERNPGSGGRRPEVQGGRPGLNDVSAQPVTPPRREPSSPRPSRETREEDRRRAWNGGSRPRPADTPPQPVVAPAPQMSAPVARSPQAPAIHVERPTSPRPQVERPQPNRIARPAVSTPAERTVVRTPPPSAETSTQRSEPANDSPRHYERPSGGDRGDRGGGGRGRPDR